MKEMTIVEIVKAVRAIDYTSSNRFAGVTSVEFDSRKCKPGSLFVPLKGQTDGHDFVQSAVENGAIVTLWDRPQSEAPDNIACIFVDDTLQALQDLAAYYRQRDGFQVIAVTGSNGKTTTKDMVAAVLETQFSVYKTQGNYNNEIGVPKTILDAPEGTQVLVVEMGMDGFDQINLLSRIARPQVAAITLIGDSHLEFLGSREGIAKAKLEIVEGLTDGGTLIIPENEPLLKQSSTQFNVKTFGEAAASHLQVTNVVTDANGTTFTIAALNETFSVPVLGKYNAMNAAIAIIVGQLYEITTENIKRALQTFTLTANRTEWVAGVNGSKILNDAYNASPTSMKAILKDFQALEATGKKIAVLGDMRELGNNSEALHASVSEVIDANRLDGLYLYGPDMAALYQVVKEQLPVYYEKDNMEIIAKLLKESLQENDVVLVKSSYGTKLLDLVNMLKNVRV